MLIPLRSADTPRSDAEAEDDVAFEKFLLEEGLVLLRSFRAIEPAELRFAIRNLVTTISETVREFDPIRKTI